MHIIKYHKSILWLSPYGGEFAIFMANSPPKILQFFTNRTDVLKLKLINLNSP